MKDVYKRQEYIRSYPAEHCFETPNLHVLMDRLRPLGMNVCFMAERCV